MRIGQLSLLKYGLFDGVSLELPKNDADIHIVYGDNEAGKSTALDAMENLLFGFEHSTPYDYRFKSGDLRVGAILEDGDISFDFLRRKGRGDTIVADDGQAIPNGEKELAALLQDVDKAFFLRMFLLNHSRLRAGSADLLTVGEDAGETLLASGAGVSGIAEILQGYDDHATSLWTKNASAKRGFYQAMRKLKEATDDQNAAVVNASEFKKVKRAFEEAQDAYNTHREQVAALKARAEKLNRIRRVHGSVNALISAETAIEKLANYTELPDDAAKQLDDAERYLQQVETKKTIHNETIERRRTEKADLDVDEALLQRATDVEALEVMRIKVQDGKDDLPRRKEELTSKQVAVEALAKELGWVVDDKKTAKNFLPSTLDVSSARSLVTEHAGLTTRHEGATTALTKARQQVIRCKKAVTDSDDTIDPSALRAAYGAAQEDSAVVGRRESAEVLRDRAQKAIDALRAGMRPTVGDDAALRSMSVPTLEAVEQQRDYIAQLRTKRDDLNDDLRREQTAIDELKYDREDMRAGGFVLSDNDIQVLRNQRDEAWDLFIRRHVDGEVVDDGRWQQVFGSDSDGRAVYASLTGAADQGADDRFTNAETSARLTELGQQIKRIEKRTEATTADLANNQSLRDAANTEWLSMWSNSGVTPEEPDTMMTWSASRTTCLEKLDEREGAAVQAEQLVRKEQALRDALTTAIAALDADAGPFDGQSLTQVMSVAKQIDNKVAETNQAAADRDTAMQTAEDEQATAVASLEAVRTSIADWQSRWDIVVDKLGLSTSTKADEVEAHIGLIDNVRRTEEQIDDLRQNRIEKIERDITVFGERADALVEAVAPDLAGKSADDIVVKLNGRLADARSNQQKQEEAADDIERCQALLNELVEDEQDSAEVIANLHRLASTKSVPKLREAIAKSNTSRELVATIGECTDTLEQDGDSRTIEELRREVDGVDLDEALVEANQIRADLTDLEEKTIALQNAMLEEKGTFEEIGASSDAAAAASRRQYALAELERVAESFVRARTSERLLRWGIDHFRRQKQGPLLEKASSLFNLVTGGRYQRLVVQYDEDTPILAGVDADDTVKVTTDMSDGTRDQLYLALRLAAVEDYIERSTPMPFVADDIFVNFDESRTTHAMRALHELAKSCQVIVFTHHSHVVEIARTVIDGKASVVSLP